MRRTGSDHTGMLCPGLRPGAQLSPGILSAGSLLGNFSRSPMGVSVAVLAVSPFVEATESGATVMHHSSHRHLSLSVALVLTGSLLAGCDLPFTSAPDSAPTLDVTPVISESPSPSPSPEQSPSPTLTRAHVPGAYPGAGGPRPENATQVTAVYSSGVATIITPSENIGCDFSGQNSYAGCGIDSYVKATPYGPGGRQSRFRWLFG